MNNIFTINSSSSSNDEITSSDSDSESDLEVEENIYLYPPWYWSRMSEENKTKRGNNMYLFPLNIIDENNTTAINGVKFGWCGIILENITNVTKIKEKII